MRAYCKFLLALAFLACFQMGWGQGLRFQTLMADYYQAVQLAAMHQSQPIQLYKLPVGKQRAITVSTWTKAHYNLGSTKLSHLVWVTISNHLRATCYSFVAKNLSNQFNELLGMPPRASSTNWHIVTMRIRLKQYDVAKLGTHKRAVGLFRPCFSSASVRAGSCSYHEYMNSHYDAWLKQQKHTGYPWTGLGYTYNWAPNASSIVGLNEFIVPKNEQVQVLSIQRPAQFCDLSNSR